MASVQTTLAAGTDSQAFCYDEQNRLVWATSQTATGPAGCGASNTAGTLTSQGASYTYDALNRLTSSPLGSYTYGDPSHLHAVTAVSNGYAASYNPAGAMTCRAPSSSATCAAPVGSQTGAGLGYNNEGQQIGWQNTLAGTPTTTAHAAYDGEGRRVVTNVVSNGVTTSTTDYLAGGLEEVTTAGSTTTLTKYESVPGVCSVVIVGSGPSETISYVTTDGLGSVSEALDGNGNVTAQQLYGPYGPYGTGRFSLGTMPTAKGFTGQEGDATTGLDYYGARYYDPLVGQFTSADTAGDGLNRYAYVGGNPETATDPTGHFRCDDSGCQRKGGNHGNGGCTFDCGAPYLVSSSIGSWIPVGNPVAGSASNNWLTTLFGYQVDHECFSDGHCQDLDLYSQRQVCDQTCRNSRNEAAKANQIKSLRDRGTVEKLFGVAFVTIGSLLLGSLVPALRGILRIAIALAGVVAGFSGLPGAAGHIFAQVGAVLSALVTTLYAVLALSSAILFAATLVTDGLRAAVDAATFGLGSVFRLGAGIGLSLIGWALETKGTADLASAGDQDKTRIGDWCSTYGRGQCQ